LLSKAGELPAGFGDLFSQEAADELLSRRGLRTPFIRVAKDGKVIATSRYTRPGGVGAMVADQVADDRILELFLDGHTVVLQGLHRLWPPIIDFAGALTTDLGHPVQVNAYITPPSSTGFSAHYDVHDVFVLQIAGEKRWRIHEPVLVDPLRDQPWENRAGDVAARASEPPLIDEVLRPGDTLYLPRGYLHAAEALGEVSIHLTVGVHPVTRHAVLEVLTDLVGDEPALRSSLPLGVDVSDPAQIEADVAATAEALVDRLRTVTTAQVADLLAARAVPGNRAAPISPLRQAEEVSRLGGETVLEVRPHVRHALRHDEEHVVVTLPDRQLVLPLATGKAVKALLDGARLRVAELPGLDPDDALVLARRLVREAVVVVVDRQ
jgi:lysine-specific demethylase/histidyl-hydroxylase NO66